MGQVLNREPEVSLDECLERTYRWSEFHAGEPGLLARPRPAVVAGWRPLLTSAVPSRSHSAGALRRVARNALYNAGAWAGSVLVSIAVTPYLVRKLTVEGYGVYALLTSLLGYSSLVDLGLGQGVTKHVAEDVAKDKPDGVVALLGAALWVQALLGVAGGGLLALCAGPLLRLLGVPAALRGDARVGLYAIAGGFFFTMLAGIFSSVLMGLQRYDVTSRVSLATSAALNLTVVGLLNAGQGLKGAVLASAVVAAATCLVYAAFVRRALPGPWRAFLRFDPRRFRTLFGFGGYLFLSKVASLFNSYIVRLVVAVILGPAAVTLYVVPMRIITAVGGVLSNVAVVVFPFASELSAAGHRDRLVQVYVRGSRYLLAIAFPLYVALALFSRPIMVAWMGPDFGRQAAPVLSLLAAAYLLSAATMIPTNVVLGMGRSRVVGSFSAGLLVMGLAVIAPLTVVFSVVGTAWGLLISQALALIFVAYVTVRVLHVSLAGFTRDVAAFHVLGVAFGVVWVGGMEQYVLGTGLAAQMAVAVVFVTLYYSVCACLGWVPLGEIVDVMCGRPRKGS